MDEATTQLLTIGDVSEKTGLPVKRIHYYERRGLGEPAGRSEAGYRLYTEEEVAKLEFVKRAKLLGLTLDEIAELVGVAEGCNEGQIFPRIEELLAEKIAETERKIAELSAFQEGLLYYRERANSLKDGVLSERYCEDASFCGCFEAVTKGGEDEKQQ
jgi:MerR family transcriptional regulator, copper efflux regulator